MLTIGMAADKERSRHIEFHKHETSRSYRINITHEANEIDDTAIYNEFYYFYSFLVLFTQRIAILCLLRRLC